jgi:hypothetical protein
MGLVNLSDNPLRRQALLLQQPDQQSVGSFGIAAGLDDLFKNIIFLIDCTPKSMFSACYGNHDFVQMPDILARRFPSA